MVTGGQTLDFLERVLGHVAWPATILVIVYLLRGPLSDLISRIRRASWGDKAIDFQTEMERLEAKAATLPRRGDGGGGASTAMELSDLVRLSPRAAVLEAWAQLEAELRRLAEERGLDTKSPRYIQELTRAEVIWPDSAPLLQHLRQLRNAAAHDPSVYVTREAAQEFIQVAQQLSGMLRRPSVVT